MIAAHRTPRSPARLRAAAVLAFGLALLVPSAAHAYCRSTTCTGDCPRDDDGCKTTGHPLFWPSACVGFSLQRDGTVDLTMQQVRGAAVASFVAWSDQACDAGGVATIAFTELGDVACKKSEFDREGPNANIVLFQDTKWRYHGADDTLAQTTVTFDPSSGQILDADIEVNHAYNELTVGDDHVVYDLRSILTHEVGHLLGFDHSLDPDATMNAAYDPGTTDFRTLAADDVAALCAAYPPDREARCDPKPVGGFADDCIADRAEAGDEGGCSVARGGAGEARTIALGIAALALAARAARRRS